MTRDEIKEKQLTLLYRTMGAMMVALKVDCYFTEMGKEWFGKYYQEHAELDQMMIDTFKTMVMKAGE